MSLQGQKPVKSIGSVLITGGCGFLGSRLAELLLSRSACSKLTIVDIRPPLEKLDNVTYHFGDITDYDGMKDIFEKARPNVVLHTASPHFNIPQKEIMYKVNVDGTKNLIKVAQETGVRAFVITSSASVISDNTTDLVNADESYPYCQGAAQPLYYTTTKVQAEIAVLEANRTKEYPKFLTAAVRPAGIFGVGDVQMLPPTLAAYYKGQTGFQLGNNNNLFDFTEVTNVAHAHHLAAAGLVETAAREDAGQAVPLDTERIDGEAFFVTNDNPVFFWDFTRSMWTAAGDKRRPGSQWVVPQGFALFLASIFEWIFWFFRLGEPNLSTHKVKMSCMTRYYNITKAKQRLGYKPIVSLDAGVKRGVADAIKKGVVPGMPENLKGVVPEKLQLELDELDKKQI